jgi:hypothetical protein
MRTLAILLLAAVTAAAQTPAPDWNSVKNLAPGTEIRVERAGGPSVRGRLRSASDETLVVDSGKGEEMLPRQQVARLAVRGRGHRGRNTLIGLGVGAGVGLVIGFATRASPNQLQFVPNSAVIGGLTGAGALVGTIVGVAIPTGGWRTVYRR